MTLFGTDGIRGKYGNFPLDDLTIKKIGYSIVKSFDNTVKKIIVGHDGRESCTAILESLIDGMNFINNYEIINLELFPTPSLPVILSKNDSGDAIGIEITASHNPYSDNGIKIFNRDGYKISSELETQIEEIVASQHELNKTSDIRFLDSRPMRSLYIDFISNILSSIKRCSISLNIAIDCANGATSHVIDDITLPNNISLSIFNNSPNGKNINDKCGAVHPEYLSKLISEVNEKNDIEHIDFGICFDGDGDRAILIDSSGNILDGDDLLYILSFYSEKSNKVVGTVMTNFGIRRSLKKNGIEFIESAVGDKNVLDAMIKHRAFLGAESSGHIIHTDVASIPIGDGLITMIKMIEILCSKNKTIEELYPINLKIPSKLINIECKSPEQLIKNNNFIFSNVEEILGNNGRILVRKSGTQSLIRILMEHESIEVLKLAEQKLKLIE